mmetsp:Transcript_4366/g.4350  ORF Transcript_4366/g.4350 Transcript_4366/m.4350 type:complete len:599 (+) Transcript_4366:190-1986(+)
MVLETHLYDILLVSPDASTEEISRSYRKVALKCHPDKTNHDPELTEQFKEVTRAYEILKDEKARDVYNHYGEAGLNGTCESKTGASGVKKYNNSYNVRTATDIFSNVFNDINSMFGRDPFGSGFEAFLQFPMNMNMNMGMNMNMNMSSNMNFNSGSSQGNFKRSVEPAPNANKNKMIRGHDIHHTCKLGLENLYGGKIVKFQLPKNSRCSTCIGLGGINPKSCRVCQGNGQVFVTLYNQFSQFQELRLCKQCNGTGIYITPNDRCFECDNGYVKEKKIIKVNILPGFKNGDKIILQGEGDEGRNIIPGDVVIHLEEMPHPYLVRRSNDLYMDYDIDLRTALLGGSIILDDFLKQGQDLKININVHGNEDLNQSIGDNIQEGEIVGTINSGTPKIVKNSGMPINNLNTNGVFYQTSEDINETCDMFDLKNYARGDLFIRFNVIMPSVSDFKDDKSFYTLANILPNTIPQVSKTVPQKTLETHLSNIPNFTDDLNSKQNATINPAYSSGPSEDSLDDKQSHKKLKKSNYGNYTVDDISNSEYDYDDINIEDDNVDGNESEEEQFYASEWSKEKKNRGKKRKKDDSFMDGSNSMHDSGIQC